MLNHKVPGDVLKATEYNTVVEQTNCAKNISGVNGMFANINPLIIKRINEEGNAMFGYYIYAINKTEMVTWDGNTPSYTTLPNVGNQTIRFGEMVSLTPLYHELEDLNDANQNKITMSAIGPQQFGVFENDSNKKIWDYSPVRRQNLSNAYPSANSLRSTYCWGIAGEDIPYGSVGKIYVSGYCYATYAEWKDSDFKALQINTDFGFLFQGETLNGDAQIVEVVNKGTEWFGQFFNPIALVLFGHSQKDRIGMTGGLAMNGIINPGFLTLTGKATKSETENVWRASPEYQYKANMFYWMQHGVL